MAKLQTGKVLESLWRWFCRGVAKVFYSRCEVSGLEFLPPTGAVLLCANHTNALADAVVIQAQLNRPVHPLARSGLFSSPFLRPVLKLQQAVPVYRRQDNEGDTRANVDSFARVYDMFANGGVVLIFPEGQSHSDPSLRELKTGAARITLGAKLGGGTPKILPVGLNFSNKGKFRSQVFVRIGPAVDTESYDSPDNEQHVRQLTHDIHAAMEQVTINVESYEDLELVRSLERFFAMRHGKYRRRSMELRFRSMKRLVDGLTELKRQAPAQLQQLKRQLQQFERLCRNWGIHDYHLTFEYRPTVVTRFLLRSLAILFLLLPLAFWGILNSLIPYELTRHLAHRLAHGTDQYDTAKMVIGLVSFTLFWGGQLWLVIHYAGMGVGLAYLVSLPLSAAAAVMFKRERHRIWDNLRVFFLFLRKRKLRPYLEARRQRLEKELAHLVRVLKRGFAR